MVKNTQYKYIHSICKKSLQFGNSKVAITKFHCTVDFRFD